MSTQRDKGRVSVLINRVNKHFNVSRHLTSSHVCLLFSKYLENWYKCWSVSMLKLEGILWFWMNGKDLEGESLRIGNYYQKLTDKLCRFSNNFASIFRLSFSCFYVNSNSSELSALNSWHLVLHYKFFRNSSKIKKNSLKKNHLSYFGKSLG